MKKSKFKHVYLIFLAACITLSAAFLIYVLCVVKAFDKSQPEHLVTQKIEWLYEQAKNGTLAQELDFNNLCSNRYENNDIDYYSTEYIEKIKNSALTYSIAATESSDLSKSYAILADNKSIGTLTLTGTNSRSRLFFFNMADWSESSFTPIVSDAVYNLTVYAPDGTEVFINGIQPTAEELDSTSEIPCYHISNLLCKPQIEYKQTNGTPMKFVVENNIAKPAVFDYEFTLPKNISVFVNGRQVSGYSNQDNSIRYSVVEMTKPAVTFKDVLGNTAEYNGNSSLTFTNCIVTMPENFKMTIDGIDADSLVASASIPHPDRELLKTYANIQLPDRKSYEISLLTSDAKAVISDGNGNSKEYVLDSSSLDVYSLNDGLPEDISANVDVMEIAKNWSRFMTDDLVQKDGMGYHYLTESGEEIDKFHGLDIVQKYFIKNSDYYNHAYEWATGDDIDFTSIHTITGFANEQISDFSRYSENCFSCKVYFEKNMNLYFEQKYAGRRTDIFNSIMYFVYIDDTPDNGINDPHWAIAVMYDVIEGA